MYKHNGYQVEEFCESLEKALGRKKVKIVPDCKGGYVTVKYRSAVAGWIIHTTAEKYGFHESEGNLSGDVVEMLYA